MTDSDALNSSPRWVVASLLNVKPLAQFVEWALRRQGFENSDIGCGILYADASDADLAHIPPGYVEIYLGWGAPDGSEAIMQEADYLAILGDAVREAGITGAASTLDAFRPIMMCPNGQQYPR